MAVTLTVTSANNISQPNLLMVAGAADAYVRFRRSYAGKTEDITGSWPTSGGAASYGDYLYPFDVPVTYTVYDATGTILRATAAPTTPVSSNGLPWIRDLVFPGLRYAPVIIAETGDRIRAGRVTPFYVMAQPAAITVGDVRSASAGTLQLLCVSHTDRDNVLFALSTGSPCVLRVPAACRVVIDEMFFTPLDITETRLGSDGRCLLSVDYVETDPSDILSFQPVTYAVQKQNATTAALLYGTLSPMPTGLAYNFYGKNYAAMYTSPNGITP